MSIDGGRVAVVVGGKNGNGWGGVEIGGGENILVFCKCSIM